LRLEQESKPENIWTIERELLTKQIELTALANESDDKKSMARKQHVQKEVDNLKDELKTLNDAWKAEKEELERRSKVQEELEQARQELDRARQRGDYNKAGELMHSTIPRLEREMEELEVESHDEQDEKMLSDAVTAEAIATIVARHTGIPVSRITGTESDKLLHMEDKLRQRVVGQEEALVAVSNCVRLARTRLQAENRTLGNFLFLGPTGMSRPLARQPFE
jgi:ATP-dependent Clp protease ATP-binding subunit ClpB